MAKYKFPQFNVEIDITDPTIEVCMRTIMDDTLDKLLDVAIYLKTENAEIKGFRLQKIPYVDTWDDPDVMDLVLERLKDYEAQ